MNDRKAAFVEQPLQRSERRVKGVKGVQVNGALVAGCRLGDGDAGTQGVVALLPEWNHGIEAVHAAALEDDHQDLAAIFFLSLCGANHKGGGQPQGEESQTRILDKNPA